MRTNFSVRVAKRPIYSAWRAHAQGRCPRVFARPWSQGGGGSGHCRLEDMKRHATFKKKTSQKAHPFPKAAGIKNHELGDLKQSRCIALPHWRPQVQKQDVSKEGHAPSHTCRGTTPGLFLDAGGWWQALPFLRF